MAATATQECASTAAPQGGVSSSTQALADAVMQIYRTRDAKEQCALVDKHYSPQAHFVDPLMDVAHPRDICVAFYSLIKLFNYVKAEQKTLTPNPQPHLPSGFKTAGVEQYVLRNQQVYPWGKGTIDLDVTTYLTLDKQTGLIVRHEDTWNNKGFKVPKFLKGTTGAFSMVFSKIAGWGKQVDAAKGSA